MADRGMLHEGMYYPPLPDNANEFDAARYWRYAEAAVQYERDKHSAQREARKDEARDAARYRLLRCFHLSGHWPKGVDANPGVVGFFAGFDDPAKYTLDRLDALFDEMLAFTIPNRAVRTDYKEWRTAKTQAAIDAAMSAALQAEHGAAARDGEAPA